MSRIQSGLLLLESIDKCTAPKTTVWFLVQRKRLTFRKVTEKHTIYNSTAVFQVWSENVFLDSNCRDKCTVVQSNWYTVGLYCHQHFHWNKKTLTRRYKWWSASAHMQKTHSYTHTHTLTPQRSLLITMISVCSGLRLFSFNFNFKGNQNRIQI